MQSALRESTSEGSRRIPVLEKLAGENVPAPRNPCLPQHRIDDAFERGDVVRVVAIHEVVFVGRVNRLVFCRIVLRGHLADRLLRDPERLHPAGSDAVRVGARGHAWPDCVLASLEPVGLDGATVRAFEKIPLAVGKLGELFPADEKKLGALVLQQVCVRLHVPEEEIRAVVERDDVFRCVVAAIERSGNLLLEEILDPPFLHCSEGATKQEAVRAWHEQALRDRFPEQRSGLAAAAPTLKQRVAGFGRVKFRLYRLRRVEPADVDIS